MPDKRLKLIAIFVSVIVLVSIGTTYLYFHKSENNYSNDGDYMDVFYIFKIETNNTRDYTMYVPIPTNVDNSSLPNPLVYELLKSGNISTSVVEVDTPSGKKLALFLKGRGNATLEYHRHLYCNSSYEKITLRRYQITDLTLLKNRTTAYIYFNSSSDGFCRVYLETRYLSHESEGNKEWRCFWKTPDYVGISSGWNEVSLIYYSEPVV